MTWVLFVLGAVLSRGALRARAASGAAGGRALRPQFERHGAPLVMRMDRARQHSVPGVQTVLDKHGVLALHGPAHWPRYYGHLERQ
jgi:hypothetical protein